MTNVEFIILDNQIKSLLGTLSLLLKKEENSAWIFFLTQLSMKAIDAKNCLDAWKLDAQKGK